MLSSFGPMPLFSVGLLLWQILVGFVPILKLTLLCTERLLFFAKWIVWLKPNYYFKKEKFGRNRAELTCWFDKHIHLQWQSVNETSGNPSGVLLARRITPERARFQTIIKKFGGRHKKKGTPPYLVWSTVVYIHHTYLMTFTAEQLI